MKNCILVLLFAVLQYGVSEAKPLGEDYSSDDYESEELTSKEETCVEELHLDRNTIILYNNAPLVVDNNTDFNNFLECYWKKEEWINDKGEVDYPNMIVSLVHMSVAYLKGEPDEVKTAVKERITEAVDYCKDHPPPKGDTPGQTAVRVQNCLMIEGLKIINSLEAFSKQHKEIELDSEEQECLSELNLNEDVLDGLYDEHRESNADLVKFLACSWQKGGYMDSKGEMDFGVIESDLKEQLAELFKGETQKNKKILEKAVEDRMAYCKENYVKTESVGTNIFTLQSCFEKVFNLEPIASKIYEMLGFCYL